MQLALQMVVISVALLTPALFLAYRVSADSKRPSVLSPPASNPSLRNIRAFLLMIQYAEGTLGTNAYRMMYGGGLFFSFRRHPNQMITKGGFTSTAAGAYQFLYRTWVDLEKQLHLPDFSPSSQDRAAIELIRRKGALEDGRTGRIKVAIYKCRKVWASFPGAGYGQSERNLKALLQAYQQFGGSITS